MTSTQLPSIEQTVEQLMQRLARGVDRRYPGEPVSHWLHALQTATLALHAKASDALVTAALLHDIGHLDDDIVDRASSFEGENDRHEARGARWLSAWFGPAVCEPVRLHVEAKRFLVADSPRYAERLSADSVRSLALQGGPMTPEACAAFIALPHAKEAVRLRCWDDVAKDPEAPPPPLAPLVACLRSALRSRGGL